MNRRALMVCSPRYTLLLTLVLAISPRMATADPVVVLRGARLIDGTGSPPRENVDVVLDGATIEAVAPAGSARVPDGARIFDCQGKTIIPGLISGHSHLGQYDGTRDGSDYYTRDNVVRQLRQFEAYGVTTIMSLGRNVDLFYTLREESRAGKLPGADILGADLGIGAAMGAPGPLMRNAVDQIDRPQTPEAAREAVRAAKARGTDCIKMWVDSRGMRSIPRDVFAAVIAEAHQAKLRVFAHVFTLADAQALVDAGVDVIAHGIRDQPVDRAFIDSMKAKSVWYIPTIALDEAFYIYADRPLWFDEPFFRHSVQPELAKQIDDPKWREKTLSTPSLKASREAVQMNQRNLAILHEAGVQVGFGTESGAFPLRIPGFAEHRELELMTAAGVPPLDILTIATGQTARMLGLEDRGTIAAGKRADLVVLDADPSTDITRVHQIHAVWHRGRKVGGAVTGFQP